MFKGARAVVNCTRPHADLANHWHDVAVDDQATGARDLAQQAGSHERRYARRFVDTGAQVHASGQVCGCEMTGAAEAHSLPLRRLAHRRLSC